MILTLWFPFACSRSSSRAWKLWPAICKKNTHAFWKYSSPCRCPISLSSIFSWIRINQSFRNLWKHCLFERDSLCNCAITGGSGLEWSEEVCGVTSDTQPTTWLPPLLSVWSLDLGPLSVQWTWTLHCILTWFNLLLPIAHVLIHFHSLHTVWRLQSSNA